MDMDFFNVMIEKEFGINPDTHEEISYSFVGQISSLKEETMERLNSVEDQVKITVFINYRVR